MTKIGLSKAPNRTAAIFPLLSRSYVSVFAEPPWQGTEAVIVTSAKKPSEADMKKLAAEHGAPATCYLWQSGVGYRVSCYAPGGPIECCGHGLLAAAYALHRQLPEDTDRAFQGGRTAFIAIPRMFMAGDGQPIPVVEQQQKLWLGLPRITCVAWPVPSWAQHIAVEPPLRAALAGGENGYLVLEFADAAAVKRIDAQSLAASLGAYSQRALIATAVVAGGGAYDYVNRYFAPQYGAAEDPVTGSAHRVLADYWSRCLNKQRLRGLQCSPSGGVVETRLLQDVVELSGRVELLASVSS